jgi:hypothetical protein
MEVFPVGTKNVLNSLHVDSKSPLNLLGPDNFISNVWIAFYSVEIVLLLLLILVVQKFLS